MNFTLSPDLEAHEPPEARGLRRDQVRLLMGSRTGVSHHRFTDLPDLLRPEDLLVVNNSATMPAAVDVIGEDLVTHFSTGLDDGRWIVELRRDLKPYFDAAPRATLELKGGARAVLEERFSGRLWIASLDVESVPGYLAAYGRPIRYSHVDTSWPVEAYQTVFTRPPFAHVDQASSREAGSAEMPSAGRPFTREVVARLADRGVGIAPITLHTGVASPEAHERPYPERFRVPDDTAALINRVRAAGRRVIAVGTTVVRAVESAALPDGTVVGASGWTDLVVTPQRGVFAVDGLLTGFHEPRASHLLMLEAVAGRSLLQDCYHQAIAAHYLWHEFGDLNLLLP